MKTIAISGATGFVGAHLVRSYAQKGYNVIGIGRQIEPPKNLLKYAKWITADITKKMENIDADIVIHAAAHASDKGSWKTFEDTNINGTINMWNASKNCHTFIYISSASIYTSSPSSYIKEKDIGQKLSFYGQSKLLAEQFLHKANENLDKKVIILRPRAIYGTHDRVLLPRMLKFLKKDKLFLPDCMDIKISMTHISNLIHATEIVLENTCPSGIYNVADKKVYVLRDILIALSKAISKEQIRIINIPYSALKILANISDTLGIHAGINRQSLEYISQSLVLDINKITNYEYRPTANFYNSLTDLAHWIEETGLDYIKSGNKGIPWSKF